MVVERALGPAEFWNVVVLWKHNGDGWAMGGPSDQESSGSRVPPFGAPKRYEDLVFPRRSSTSIGRPAERAAR